jgi:hypothetical protein
MSFADSLGRLPISAAALATIGGITPEAMYFTIRGQCAFPETWSRNLDQQRS